MFRYLSLTVAILFFSLNGLYAADVTTAPAAKTESSEQAKTKDTAKEMKKEKDKEKMKQAIINKKEKDKEKEMKKEKVKEKMKQIIKDKKVKNEDNMKTKPSETATLGGFYDAGSNTVFAY